ncbi:hypothetical protein ACM26V_00125 [Salipaludibacillus sp. HK11]|uniref:hypothetical protein n=1 Tax=Salipaludibacillus sp. HK11 TaxID=3394320 RepID=UPI0039FDA722
MNDSERKVYRIAWNINHTKSRHTTYKELLFKSGRTEKELNEVLQSLVDQKLIWWDKDKTKDVAINKNGPISAFNKFTN